MFQVKHFLSCSIIWFTLVCVWEAVLVRVGGVKGQGVRNQSLDQLTDLGIEVPETAGLFWN